MALAWGSFTAAIVLAAAFGLFLDYQWGWFAPGAAIAAMLLAATVGVYCARPDESSLQLGFGLLGIATACLAAGWLAAVT
jgi:hypothetical protein